MTDTKLGHFFEVVREEFESEIDIQTSFQNFVKSKKQVFYLSAPLVGMLCNSSLYNVQASFLESPYLKYYLYFGHRKALEIRQGWYVDGVYIQHFPDIGLIQFLFTSSNDDISEGKPSNLALEPCFALSVGNEYFQKDLGEVISMVLDRRKIILTNKAENAGNIDLATLNSGITFMRKALEVAFNSMCYLTGYPDDILPEPINNQSALMDEEICRLASLDCRKIHICGLEEMEEKRDHADENVKHNLSTHWLRGYWKKLANKPGDTKRKLALVKPAFISPGECRKDDNTGSIYIGPNAVDLEITKKRCV